MEFAVSGRSLQYSQSLQLCLPQFACFRGQQMHAGRGSGGLLGKEHQFHSGNYYRDGHYFAANSVCAEALVLIQCEAAEGGGFRGYADVLTQGSQLPDRHPQGKWDKTIPF